MMQGIDIEGPLAEVVDLAAPERFVRPILDEGAYVSQVVRRVADVSVVVGGAGLATALGAPVRYRRPALVPFALTERERDVLRFLPTRLTTGEIASECFMSLNTVKAHLKKIYGKLGVHNRADAVARARLLGEFNADASRTV
jgi:LuxR family maltose regulon positive regulatory protein